MNSPGQARTAGSTRFGYIGVITPISRTWIPQSPTARAEPIAGESITASNGVHRDAHDELAKIAPIKHRDESFRCVFEAVYDVLAVTDAAVRDAGSDLAQEIGVVLRGKIVVDEPAQGEALRHDAASGHLQLQCCKRQPKDASDRVCGARR